MVTRSVMRAIRRRVGRRRSGEGPRRARECLTGAEGSQLLEFAFVLPFLVVLAIGVADFGEGYNLKQKLNNAAREGARMAASSPVADLNCGGACGSTPSSITAIRNAVANYLTNAEVTYCAISTSGSQSGTARTWTYAVSGTGCPSCPTGSTCNLQIGRAYWFTSGNNTEVASRVTLTYPYTFTFGRVIGLLAQGPSDPSSIAITSNAIALNLQ